MAKEPVEVKVTLTQVRVIEKRGPACVVEYAGGLKRCIVPADEIVDGSVSVETLEAGAPYGLPWERLVTLSATPEKLAEALRANGIWTAEDLDNNVQAVLGALQAVYGVDLARLLQAAHNKGG